jgi:hypothetical protein
MMERYVPKKCAAFLLAKLGITSVVSELVPTAEKQSATRVFARA